MSIIAKKINKNINDISFQGEVIYSGKVTRFDGKIAECHGFPSPIGTICELQCSDKKVVTAEIIGFKDKKNLLAIHDQNANIVSGAKVVVVDSGVNIGVGSNLLGRVINAYGEPLDGKTKIFNKEIWPISGKSINPMNRKPITKPLDVGIKAINSLLTVGQGQRIGIIAGSGVGKSILLGMMSRFTEADVVVVALIGERGREVGSFISQVLNDETRKKTVIVAVPAEQSPLLRIRGAERATAISEYFRSKGKNVLLIMDSLTRIAHAKREVGLALGEQPTSKGYPPSVISMLPNLIERTGSGDLNEGSITAFYTILADSDDTNDPVVDTSRAILDGHILLSREHAQMGIYPAIDINQSLSRVMNSITKKEHQEKSNQIKKLYSLYLENRELILMGGYTEGQNEDIDMALNSWTKICNLIKQGENEKSSYEESLKSLYAIK